MTAWRLFRSAVIVLLVMVVSLPLYAAKPTATSAPKISQKAVDLLKQMGGYLSGLQSFSVHVETARDLMAPTDEALTSSLSYNLTVRRPDGLRVDMCSAARSAQVFYDGKTLTVFTPEKNYYAVTPAPATIEATLKEAMKRGISLPLADLVYANTNQRLLANITSATFVGTSYVDGVATNQLAFRQKGIDWQIWIEDSSTPLPRRVMIISKTVRDMPRFVATFSDWNTNPALDDSTFRFVAPEGAKQIKFSEIPRQGTQGKPAPVKPMR